MTTQPTSLVKILATDAPDQPARTPDLEQLYRGFEQELLVPLWTEIGDLMPERPTSRAIATGTTGGVGHARKPPRYLSDGSRVVTEIGGIGRLDNVARL